MYIGPDEFEDRWAKLLDEFSLHGHKWLTKMFGIRSCWIPAYFIDSPLCGLMRTTSRSESENNFFSHFTNSGSTLMNFMNCFETAMEKQRHIQERLDHKTIDSVPTLRTYLKIERHASNVYTRPLFELVQSEIFTGTWFCQIDSKSVVEGSEVSIIKETKFVDEYVEKKKAKKKEKAKRKLKDKGNDKGKDEEVEEPVRLFYRVDGLYKVLRNLEDGSVVCSCQLFLRVGILCRHVFCVLKNANIEVIPSQYILRRWTKNLIPASLRNKRNRYGEKNEIVENYANEASSIVDHCVHILSKDEPRLSDFVEKLRLLKIDVEADCPNPPSKNKADNLEELVGVPKPAEKIVNNPSVGSTKGRKKSRIKGAKEQALDKNSKNKNACSLCGATDGHNRRTCPKKYIVEDDELVQAEVSREDGDLDQAEVSREDGDLDQSEVTREDGDLDKAEEIPT